MTTRSSPDIVERMKNYIHGEHDDYIPEVLQLACAEIERLRSVAQGWNATQRELEIRQLRIDNARLRDEAFLRSRDSAQAQRTCATCHAVLADGPQPSATYSLSSTQGNAPCSHAAIISLDGCWHCQKCGDAIDMATAHSSTEGKTHE